MTLEIRRMAAGDEALLDRVAEDVFDAPIDPARLAAFLADPRHLMVLALNDGVVVGQGRAIVHLSPDLADQLYIDQLGVAPPLWRQGIGGRLLDGMLAWGRERGCASAWLATETGNVEARALYASRGGREQGMVFFEWGGGQEREG